MAKIQLLSIEAMTAPEVKDGVSPARKAADKLLKAGMDQTTLELDLNNVILNPPPRHKYRLGQKTPKQARLFPERVLSFAREIEQVNSSMLYELLDYARKNPTAKDESWLLDSSYKRTFQAFEGLPKVLKSFAELANFAIRQRRRMVTDQDHCVIILMHHVRQATGKPYYPEVAILLEALFKVRKLNTPYDEPNLRDLYRRTRKRLRPEFLSTNHLG